MGILFLLFGLVALLTAVLVTNKNSSVVPSISTVTITPSVTVAPTPTVTTSPVSAQIVYDTFDEAGGGTVSLNTHTSNLGQIWSDFPPYIQFDLYQGQGYISGPDTSLIANQIAMINYTPTQDNIKITYTYLTPTLASGHIVTLFGVINVNGDGVIFEIFYNQTGGTYGLQILNMTGFVPDVGSPVSSTSVVGTPTLNTQIPAVVTITATGDVTFDADSMSLITSAILHKPNGVTPDINTFIVSDSYQAPGGVNMYQIFEVLVERTN